MEDYSLTSDLPLSGYELLQRHLRQQFETKWKPLYGLTWEEYTGATEADRLTGEAKIRAKRVGEKVMNSGTQEAIG